MGRGDVPRGPDGASHGAIELGPNGDIYGEVGGGLRCPTRRDRSTWSLAPRSLWADAPRLLLFVAPSECTHDSAASRPSCPHPRRARTSALRWGVERRWALLQRPNAYQIQAVHSGRSPNVDLRHSVYGSMGSHGPMPDSRSTKTPMARRASAPSRTPTMTLTITAATSPTSTPKVTTARVSAMAVTAVPKVWAPHSE